MTGYHHGDRRGVALPLALIALTATALLAAAGLMLARLESRAGDLTLATLQATEAAESGVNLVMGSWTVTRWDTLAAGITAGAGAGSLGLRQLHTDSLLHLGRLIFLARSIGESRDAGGNLLARAELGRWLRVEPPRFPSDVALLARGPLEFAGGIAVSGNDRLPPEWTGQCPPPAVTGAAVRDSTGYPGFGPGCLGGSCLSGIPPAVVDTTLSDSVLSRYGSWTFTALDAGATTRLSGVVSGTGPAIDPASGQCDQTVMTNLGEPLDSTSSCFQFFPLIAAAPGTRIQSGRGQGILLAEGDLVLGDGFDFYGVVIVAGHLSIPGSGSRITGVVILRHAETDTVQLGGSSSIARSTCAINRAATRGVPWRPIGSRSWVRF